MHAGLAGRIAEFACRFQWRDLSRPRQRKARWFLADFLATTLAGSTLPEAASGYVLAQPGSVTLPGDTRGLSPESAAVAMGCVGALLQIHDGFGGGGNHPSSAIIAALWAAHGDRPLRELLVPAAIGYEVANRVASCTHPAMTLAGAAPTSITGAIGAAAALGRLRGLASEQLADAISIAGFTAPVAALRGLTEHGSVVPLHGGLAARCAIEAVRLAQAGLAAGGHLLEGGRDPGLIQFLRGDPHALAPETWRGEMLDGVYFKPLPACRHAQPAVEAALAILRDGPLDFRLIREIRITTYPVALMFGDPPRAAHELYDRLMSMPWAIASCLVHGGFGFDNVTAPARDARIEALYAVMRSRVDEGFSADYPGRLSTRIEVEMKNGETRAGECRMEYGVPAESGPYSPPGTTTRPLDEEGMRAKFFDLACRRISRAEAETLLDEIFEHEDRP
ncbi:MAG: MmgE/PrpD family protein [Betaproteobacteria bacterium]|nr:MmgE/PrpD family protein [Betaproteobacteria bacterium]